MTSLSNEHAARLIVELSDQELLRGPPRDLLHKAQANPYYGQGFRHEPHVSRTSNGIVNFALLVHTNFMLLLFPGSSRLIQNWALRTGNFSFRRVRQMDGKVHKGFWLQVTSYWSDLKLKLRQWSTLPVVLGGYSRGGACAVITALRVEREFGLNRIQAIITLGQPACVNFDLGERISADWGQRYIRIVTSTDLIPLAPTWPWYHQAGVVWYYQKDGTLLKKPSKDQIERAIRSDNPLMRRPKSLIGFLRATKRQAQLLIKGHGLATYRACLNANT